MGARIDHLAEELPAANERLRTLDGIPGLVATLTPAGEVSAANAQLVEYCGRGLDELRHWGTNDTVHPEDLPRVIEIFTQAMSSGDPYEWEARLRRADGVYRWFQIRGRPERDPNGPIARWYVLLTDIDDLKRAEEALRRDEALLAKVQELSATGGFYWWPASGKSIWTEQVYRIFDLDSAGPLTTDVRQGRIHPDDIVGHREVIQRAIREPREFEYEVRLVMPDDSIKYVHSLVQPTQDADGNLLYVGAVQDVTQRRLSELALSKVRSELAHVARVTTLNTLTASIAHEVNQPLSGILTNASTCVRMLAADPPNLEGARVTVSRIIRDGKRASDVITRLRALFARRALTVESVDLNEATLEVIALSSSDFHRNRITLHSELADDLPRVTGDRVELQQVILNLLRNASDAMADVHDRPREVLVRTEREAGDRVRLMVRDAGAGLERESLDQLFDAFYTTKNGGMGIGLSVSRSIIESHRGRIFATPNEGPGATFAFTIPAEPPEPAGTGGVGPAN